MQIDRHVERLRALEDRPVFLVVEETAPRVAVDHRALEAEFLHAALELVGGASGAAVGSAAKPAKRVGCFFIAA